MISENIRYIRKMFNMSQGELSILSGIGIVYLSNIETGKRNPGFSTLRKIFHALRKKDRQYKASEFIRDLGIEDYFLEV